MYPIFMTLKMNVLIKKVKNFKKKYFFLNFEYLKKYIYCFDSTGNYVRKR